MRASRILRQLLEDDNDPLDIGPLERYTGPVAFNQSIKDILDHAMFLKQQAEEAGALALIMRPNSLGNAPKPIDVDRAFLMIAVEQYNDEMRAPSRIAQILKREMHSIWD